MATSAFKSTSKRTPIGAPSASVEDSASSNRNSAAHRRSRSLSRFSRRLAEPAVDDFGEAPAAPRGRFVNTVRGSGFPEISLDDLAVEFFGSSGDRGRSSARNSRDIPASGAGSAAAQRRGRSVSRQGSKFHGSGGGGDGKGNAGNNSGGVRVGTDSSGNSRRRRSVSVVRCQISDSESDQNGSDANSKSFTSRNHQAHLSHKSTPSGHRPGLRRSFSQKDFKSCDGYSSQSSVLTDDEGRDDHFSKNGIEKTIRAVYAKKKGEHPTGDDTSTGFYEVMRKELRNAVEEIRTELEHAMVKTKSTVPANSDILNSNSSDVLKAVSSIRQNYLANLEESEKRKQDLLSEIVLEEQRSRELSKIVKELLPEQNDSVRTEKPPQSRRSTDRNRMSMRLTEEAEKYIEDFLSNVEDTDISSLDGERSDTSSSIGGITKTEAYHSPAVIVPLPVEMDGVVLPWLQWETSNEATPLPYKNKMDPPVTPKTFSWDAAQEVSISQDQSGYSASSRGSWSPVIIDSHSMSTGEVGSSKLGELGEFQRPSYADEHKTSSFDMEEYLERRNDEDILFERIRQQQRIGSGSLLLCTRMLFF